MPAYAELRCLNNFSFLRGASQPEELVERAEQLGYPALALTDECSLAGVVRAHVAAKEHWPPLLIGSQFQVQDGPIPFVLTVLACHFEGYGNLSSFIAKLRRASEKGTYRLTISDLTAAELEGCVAKALGMSLELVDAIAKGHQWWDGKAVRTERLSELGLSTDSLQIQQLLQLTGQLIGFPRHLSQHTGGFVLTKGPLHRTVPSRTPACRTARCPRAIGFGAQWSCLRTTV